jgi:glycosyltransferase involved in cell wall biosynthesis
MATRIRFEYTRYPHWGGRSGYIQLAHRLDERCFRAIPHGASDSDADLARWLTPLRPWLGRFIRRGRMPWYKLSDLNAELEAMAGCLMGRFDIVHFLDGEHSAQFLPRLVRTCRLPAVRTVATFHQPPEIARQVVNTDLLRWLDHIVLVSPSQLPFFEPHVPKDRLHVLLHGVDARFFHPAPRPNPTARIRCITAGHWLRDWRVFESVARSLAGVDGIAFDVVTDRKVDFRHLPNVTIHSGIDDATLANLYRSVDVLFLPLVQSTANNTLLEGIASGLAGVITDLEAVRAYLPDGEALLVADNQVDGFVEALRRLQRDVDLRHELGRRARARAEALAWPRIIRSYENFYTGVAAGSPVRGRLGHRRRSQQQGRGA